MGNKKKNKHKHQGEPHFDTNSEEGDDRVGLMGGGEDSDSENIHETTPMEICVNQCLSAMKRGRTLSDDGSESSVKNLEKKRNLNKFSDYNMSKDEQDDSFSKHLGSKLKQIHNLLFSEVAKVPKAVIGKILSHVNDIVIDAVKVNIENCKLKSQNSFNSNSTFVVNPTNTSNPKSFASVVANNAPAMSPKNVLFLKPSADKKMENIKQVVLESVRPAHPELKVSKLKPTKAGGVVLELDNKKDYDKLKSSKILEKVGLVASAPKQVEPHFIVYNVLKNLSDEDLVENIKISCGLENIFDKNQMSKLKVVSKRNSKFENRSHKILVAPFNMKTFILKLGKIHAYWETYKVADFINITRCFNCQSYGHPAKFCNKKSPTCGHCGQEGHKIDNCKDKDKKETCANCKRAGRGAQHSVRSDDCPILMKAKSMVINNTNYDN